jgi:hypothetical protein
MISDHFNGFHSFGVVPGIGSVDEGFASHHHQPLARAVRELRVCLPGKPWWFYDDDLNMVDGNYNINIL